MVGDYSQGQQDKAQREASAYTQAADTARKDNDASKAVEYDNKAKQAQTTADNWGDNGVYRLGLHAASQAAVGGAAGGGSGAASAGAGVIGGNLGQQAGQSLGEAEADRLGLDGQARKDLVNGYQQFLATAGGVLGGMAGGAAAGAGNGTGALASAVQGGNAGYSVDVFNRQLHPEEKVLAKELAQKSNGKYTAEQIEAQMRGTAVTRNGVTEQGTPDTVIGGIPGMDSGGTWIHAGTTHDGYPIITQQLAPEDVALKAYIANNTQGQAGIVYPPVTLPLTKATLPERLPPAPAGTTRVISVVDGVAYYPLVANCPAAACLNGDSVANAIPDSGTQAYLEAVERKVDRTVNIVSGVLGVTGAIVRAGSTVMELATATAGTGRAVGGAVAAKGATATDDVASLGTKLGNDAATLKATQWLKQDPGFYDVVVHGNSQTVGVVVDGEFKLLDQRSLATLIEKQADYGGGAIRLASCETGAFSAGFAQNLSNKLGVRVKAPTDTLFIFPNGKTVIGPNQFTNSGEWKIFYAKKVP